MNKRNKNFLINLAYQLLIFSVPLVTTPYISRVLGADNIGSYSYAYSIVTFFMLAALLGINNYGTREIAKCGDDVTLRSVTFHEIYFLQLILCFVSITGYFALLFFIDFGYRSVLLIDAVFLVSVIFDINWLFFGMEKFSLTVTRNVFIKIVTCGLVFLLIKNNGDLWKYCLLMGLSTLTSQLLLWPFIWKNIKPVHVTIKGVFRHLKSCVILFIPVLAYSIYRVMDKTMIGAISGEFELGNYENAEKIVNIPLAAITAIGTAIMPNLAKNKDIGKDLIDEVLTLNFFVIFPMLIGIACLNKDISLLMFGDEFTLAGNIMLFLIPSVLFSSIANTIRMGLLIPKRRDSIYVFSTIIGAGVNLVCNFIFIRLYGAYGACIGTIAAEFSVMLFQLIATRNDIDILKSLKRLIFFLALSCATIIPVCLILRLVNILYLRISLAVIVSAGLYFAVNIKTIKGMFFDKGG